MDDTGGMTAELMDVELNRGTFGPVLRRLRQAAGISQEELAERARLSVESISALERGRRKAPYRETLRMLADGLRLNEPERTELFSAAKRAKTASYDDFEPNPFSESDSPTISQPDRVARETFPYFPTSLIGRVSDIERLNQLILSTRLLTVVGAGGTGKTRLTVEFAKRFGTSQNIRSRFVDLAPLRVDTLTASTFASAIGVVSQREVSGTDEIVAHIGNLEILIVVDNCEHVIDEAARVIENILVSCAHARIVATSREPLQLQGETVFRLDSLSLPPEESHLSFDDICAYSSVQLFIDRARAANSEFIVDGATITDIARICRRLDGIPLALELAAAQTPSLSMHDLADSLSTTFEVLTSSSRRTLPRQETLKALIDWSYCLLTPAEATLLGRLSVFAGGWTLDAARALAATSSVSTGQVVSTISSLVRKSLVVATTNQKTSRYRLLEATRVFAFEKMSLDEREEAARCFSMWVDEFAASMLTWTSSRPMSERLMLMSAEADNIRAALIPSLEPGGDVALAATILVKASNLWYEGGLHAEARRWIQLAIERLGESEHRHIVGQLWRTLAFFLSGDPAVQSARKAINLLDSCESLADIGQAYFILAASLWKAGDLEGALEASSRSIALAKDSESQRSCWYADALDVHGTILMAHARFAEARRALRAAYDGLELRADEFGMARIKGNLAELEFADGSASLALELVAEAEQIFRRLDASARLATVCVNSAAYSLSLGDLEAARKSAFEALELATKLEDEMITVIAIQHIAMIHSLQGRASRGAQLLGYVDHWYEHSGSQREPNEQRLYEIAVSALSERASRFQLQNDRLIGQRLTQQEAFEMARAD